jgi:predicted transcriptional regulator
VSVPDALDAAIAAYQQARDAVPAAQEDARRLVADARSEADRARQRLAAAIVSAARRGMRQKEIVARTGYTRETVRRILREGGIEAD